MSKPAEKITEEHERPDVISGFEPKQDDSSKLIGFYRSMLYVAALIGGASAAEGCITTKNIREQATIIDQNSAVVSDTANKPAGEQPKPKTRMDIMWDLVKELGYEYAGPQKDGSYVWCAEGVSIDEAREKANKKAKEYLNTDKTKEVGITVEMMPNGRWIAAIRAIELPLVKEKHWKLNDKRNGTVHAYSPEHRGELDEIIVFVHGYKYMKNSVDFYWGPHLHLEKQFRESGRKALFIAPQTQRCIVDKPAKPCTPKKREEGKCTKDIPARPCTPELRKIRWKGDLQGLIDFVKSQTGVKVADNAKITVISHSGGYVTAGSWTDNPNFDEFIGSDTVYGVHDKKGRPRKSGVFMTKFRKWIGKPGKKMRLIGTSHRKSSGSRKRHQTFYRSLSRDAQSRTNVEIVRTRHQLIPRFIYKWLKRK